MSVDYLPVLAKMQVKTGRKSTLNTARDLSAPRDRFAPR